MVNRILGMIAVLLVSFPLTGCWDFKDINDMNVLLTVVVDYGNGSYSFDVEQVKQTQATQAMQTETAILESQGKTLSEARTALETKSENPIFLGAVRVVVMTDSFSRNGVEEYANRIRQMRDYRKSVNMITTTVEPKGLLSAEPKNATSVGFDIEEILTTMENNGSAIRLTLGEFLSALTAGSIGVVMPNIDLDGNTITVDGYSIFKDMRMMGHIPFKRSNGIIYMLSDFKPKRIYELPLKDNKITVRATLEKRSIEPRLEDGNISIRVGFEFIAETLYPKYLRPLSELELDTVMAKLEKGIERDILDQLRLSQRVFKCDYLSFYRYFRAKYPRHFDGINWNEEYAKAEVDVKVKAVYKPTGTTDIDPRRRKY